MRPRLPLSAKILLWFFANLLLIAIAAYAFIEFEFHLGPESLLGGRAGRRVDALADLVNGEIATQPSAQWTGVLSRAGNLYGLNLLLAAPDGRRIAGAEFSLPAPVLARLFRGRPPGPPPPRPGGAALPPDAPFPPGVSPPGQPPPLGPRPGRDHPIPPHPPAPMGPHDRHMIHTDHPSRYWLLLPIAAPLPDPARQDSALGGPRHGPPPPPLTLVAMSESIGLGGLVFDITPWLAAAAGIVIFSVLFWFPLVHGITGSIREMTAATARVAEGHFDVRVRENRADELGQLASSINAMSARLSGFVNGQKRFLGDIAHELCSPLARAQVALGIMENQMGAAPLLDLREEVQQMSGLVNELLSFSKASLAAGRIQLQPVSLHEIVTRAIARESLIGAIESTVPADLSVQAEPDLLCRAIANLLRNAVKYAGDAGPVEISAEPMGEHVILTVSDHGPGVPEEALAQLFDPFYRVDVSRARETGGAGLGLAIVKTCIESCGGRVTCRNRAPHGLTVTITLRTP